MTTTSRWYPDRIAAGDFGQQYDKVSVGFLFSEGNELNSRPRSSLQIAEFGIWKGGTSYQFARFLDGQGILHLFDYEDNVAEVKERLAGAGYPNVQAWGASYKYLDSYNWSLMKILKTAREPSFDYVYLDGAHTWAIDALTFFLCDKLLRPGGYVDFDDYLWRLRGSSLDPERVPETGLLYTDEQIDERQVKLIVDVLVKRDPRYREIVPNKIYQKIR